MRNLRYQHNLGLMMPIAPQTNRRNSIIHSTVNSSWFAHMCWCNNLHPSVVTARKPNVNSCGLSHPRKLCEVMKVPSLCWGFPLLIVSCTLLAVLSAWEKRKGSTSLPADLFKCHMCIAGVCRAVLLWSLCLIRSHLIEFTQRLGFIMYYLFTFWQARPDGRC